MVYNIQILRQVQKELSELHGEIYERTEMPFDL